MAEHVCDENCSWAQTPATLTAKGYPVGLAARDANWAEKYAVEKRYNDARYAAANAGAIHTCTRHQTNCKFTED